MFTSEGFTTALMVAVSFAFALGVTGSAFAQTQW
jgi:hypothetical protein